ncbi:unnamed protein product [Effrenium voratum]|nr:unnamed protein product [Effrenium voratum]
MGVVAKIWDTLNCRRRAPIKVDAKAPPVFTDPDAKASAKAPPPPPEAQSAEVAKAEAQAAAKVLKEKGNEHFKKNELEEALLVYTEAAQTYNYDVSIWLNRSICNRKLQNFEDAATDAEIAQEIDPSNVKAYYNRALALQLSEKWEESLKVCKKGLERQADNKALLQLKAEVTRSIAESKAACPGEMPAPKVAAKPNSKKEPKEPKEPKKADKDKAVSKLEPPEPVLKPQYGANGEYLWQNGKPGEKERYDYRTAMTDMFRAKYEELKQRAEAAKSKRSTLQTDEIYQPEQKQGLVLSGGHRPLERPDNVDVPPDYQSPVGLLTPEQLEEYGSDNKGRRYLLSVYGDIFDVSDRPDKYDPNGPYASLTGRDLTWGLFAGVDTVEYTNKFYDLFKARDLGKDKMAGVCSWLAWYTTEYGTPVGKLEPWQRESELPAPPLEEIEEVRQPRFSHARPGLPLVPRGVAARPLSVRLRGGLRRLPSVSRLRAPLRESRASAAGPAAGEAAAQCLGTRGALPRGPLAAGTAAVRGAKAAAAWSGALLRRRGVRGGGARQLLREVLLEATPRPRGGCCLLLQRGGATRFVNHYYGLADEPNCTIGASEEHIAAIRVSKPIGAGEELLVDYGMEHCLRNEVPHPKVPAWARDFAALARLNKVQEGVKALQDTDSTCERADVAPLLRLLRVRLDLLADPKEVLESQSHLRRELRQLLGKEAVRFRAMRLIAVLPLLGQASFKGGGRAADDNRTISEVMDTINKVCRDRGGHYAGYSCKVVSWDEIHYTRAACLALAVAKACADGHQFRRALLQPVGHLQDGVMEWNLLRRFRDMSIRPRERRLQAAKVKAQDWRRPEKAYNYNTMDDEEPRNLKLLCASQGMAVQQDEQDGRGTKKSSTTQWRAVA